MLCISKIKFVFILPFLASCSISSLLNLKEPAPSFSSEIILPQLSDSFSVQSKSVFPSWKNKNTANVISIVSDCGNSNQNLKAIHNLITNSIDKENIIVENSIPFQSANGYFRKVVGKIDNHDIEVQSLSFQHKNCIYMSSLSGETHKINSDVKSWQDFNRSIDFKK
jgi:hypothetical protein